MSKINGQFACDMNSVLVSCYVSGDVNCRLHQDDEDMLDSDQPICVVSFGAKRQVEFVAKNKSSKYKADLTLQPEDSSLYIMRPGCQQEFLHRVRRDKRIRKHRISLSFRRFIPQVETPAIKQEPISPIAPMAPMADMGVMADWGDLISTPPKLPPPSSPTGDTVQQEPKPPAAVTPPPPTSLHDVPQGYSPFGQNSSANDRFLNPDQQTQKICLLLGSSITSKVNGELLSRKSRTVINLSESGARIFDISKIANDFYLENACLVHKVDKIVINIGTNDVKWLNGFKISVYKKLRAPLCDMIRNLKFLFPSALIVFTTMLPISALYNYTAPTVNSFNRLLFEVCCDLGCIFFDCFRDFLSQDFRDYNRNLFRDKWHPNEKGLRVLCRAIKFCIYGNLFTSRSRTSCFSSFYNFY